MAGTINTTNYNFKKYAPNDTVSMLQTFNGNMDAIDKAIKGRADVETEQGASIAKLETGLASTNNGLNSANQTISALQVQVTTNTRNIQNANTEIDTLDSRVQALENGGSAIENVTATWTITPTVASKSLYKQGKHVFGNIFYNMNAVSASVMTSISSYDNVTGLSTLNVVKLLSIVGNTFGLNPNIGHLIGYSTMSYTSDGSHVIATPVYALYDGSTTFITQYAESYFTQMSGGIMIDFTI